MPVKCAGKSKRIGAVLVAALFMSGLVCSANAQSRPERPHVKIEKIFGDLVDDDRKLIEIEGVSLDGTQPGTMLCLIGAVRLKANASPVPPRRDLSRPSFLQFGGSWKSTPRLAEGPKGKDLLQICRAFLAADGLDDQLLNALEAPGSFYISDWTGLVLQVYAPERRLAVSIRYMRRNPDL